MINKILRNVIENQFKGYNKLKDLPISLFVYWPYCSKICPYCNFNKYRDTDKVDHERMSKSLSRELESFVNNIYLNSNENSFIRERPITSIYFGGGTPSLAKISTFVETIETMKKLFPSSLNIEDIEITLEVNPDQKDLKNLLKDFKKYVGVNRVSLGVQSLVDKDLHFLGRTHNRVQAEESIKIARDLFDHVTFDLIYSRTIDQTLEQWRNELKYALNLAHGNGHVSLYTLTFEQGTSFYRRLSSKGNKFKIIPPDDQKSSDLYDLTVFEAESMGFQQYEISSFASSHNQKGKHNLNYWRSGDFIGIGPGASSRLTTLNNNNNNNNNQISRYSFKNILHPKEWMEKLNSKETLCNAFIEDEFNPTTTTTTTTPLTNFEVAEEMLLNGLRTIEGVQLSTFTFQTNGLTFDQFLNMKQVEILQEQGFLILEPTCLKLTGNGRKLLDTIIPKILKY
ncbi:hypothetical protein ACTFIY_010383 [Dictyostelium cf. discoideum]